MASQATGEMFTQAEVDEMSEERRKALSLVRLTPSESKSLAPLSNEQRKEYLQSRKAKVRKISNKQERQNRKKARKYAKAA